MNLLCNANETACHRTKHPLALAAPKQSRTVCWHAVPANGYYALIGVCVCAASGPTGLDGVKLSGANTKLSRK